MLGPEKQALRGLAEAGAAGRRGMVKHGFFSDFSTRHFMNQSENESRGELETVATALKCGCIDSDVLQRIRALIGEGRVDEIIRTLVSREPGGDERTRESMSRVHAYLERCADKDEVSACILMTSFYPIASDSRDHDLCDSIDLWIDHCDATELTVYLESHGKLAEDEGMLRHYGSWLANKRKAS